jgi:drug/metabolite transporter (DMT)-like permease
MHRRYTSELLTLLASLFWGSSFIAVKLGLLHLDPLWFVQWRLFLASIILLAVAIKQEEVRIYFRHKTVYFLGAMNALAYLFQFIGMQFTTASAAAFYINFGIVFTALLSFIFLKEKFTGGKLVGLLLALIGVLLLSTNGQLDSFTMQSTKGAVLVLIGGFFWSVYTVSAKKLLRNKTIPVAPLTTSVFFFSSIFLLVPALIWGNWPDALTLKSGGILMYTVVICTILPFLLWTKGLKEISATVSAAVLLTEPIFAVIIAYPILEELFTIMEAVGAFFILIAIGLISFAEEKTAA